MESRRVHQVDSPPSVAVVPERRLCRWCREPLRRRARRDAVFCSTRCRQASHRFTRHAPGAVATGLPLRLAYADPPYPGLSARYYSDHPDFDGEVDHAELVGRLVSEFPDGWALSTSARSLPAVLALCPPDVRVAAWFRGARSARSYSPLNAWEPVIWTGGRLIEPSSCSATRLPSRRADLRDGSNRRASRADDSEDVGRRRQTDEESSALQERRLDALIRVARPRTTDPARVVGAKPAAFCWWLFSLLGAQPGDELADLFPGSGGVSRAWEEWNRRASTDDGSQAAAASAAGTIRKV